VILGIIGLFIISFPRNPDNIRHEKSFLNDSSLLPSLDDDSKVDLSVVIPAYNEESRLPKMLTECLNCLETSKHKTYEGFYFFKILK